MIHREYAHFSETRKAYLNSPAHAALSRSRTVMVTNLAKEYDNEERIWGLAAFVSGPIEQVWLPRAVKPIEELLEERNNECQILEKAENKLFKRGKTNARKNTMSENAAAEENADIIAQFMLEKKRPSHNIGTLADFSIGFLCTKVDTLTHSPQFMREHDEQLVLLRKDMEQYELANSAFIRFAKQTDAHMFAQQLKKNAKVKTISASTEVIPEDIIWHNLSMSPYQLKIRAAVSWALTIGLIIIWAPLVAFVGVVSSVSTLCSTVFFLGWICVLPSAVVGIIQGILPPVLLAVLFMILPIVLRIFIKQQGEPRDSDIERKLWSRFWLFQIIHGFLIVAVASGLVAALRNIGSTVSELPELLVTNIPDSTIFSQSFSQSTPHSFWLGTTGMPRKTVRKSRTQRPPVS
ncbi:DUF221-domain-containing protein [Calocera viscosa TUFC12733]|uniref:DUF221-domain-containing protein n=1 Tax=Calocera viscosa (strain TUFC12733) TaxID=1330018 RepID=A0A167ILZ4_CALVF|nr:DUF221-domain-containing protein [Calocera viscosa TUFC12733]